MQGLYKKGMEAVGVTSYTTQAPLSVAEIKMSKSHMLST